MSELTSLETIIMNKITEMMEVAKPFGFTSILDSEIAAGVIREQPNNENIDSGTIEIALNNLVRKKKLNAIGRKELNCISYTLSN